MTSNRIMIALLSGCILSLTGCSTEENETSKSIEEKADRILLTSTVSRTRSLNQNIQASQLSNGNMVGVYVTDESDGVVCDNVKITADGDGGFTYNQDLYWPVEGKASIYAYAPYQEGWKGKLSTGNTFTVDADQTTDAGYLASDLLRGVPVSGNPLEQTSNTVALAFHHMLSKVNITIINTSDTDMGGSTVSVQNVLTSASVDLQTGELSDIGSKGTVKAATFATDATSYRCSAVIMPQKLTTGTEYISITFAEGNTVAAKMRNDVELESGKTYNFTITVGVGGADMITATSLDDWDEDTSMLEGEIDLDGTQDADEEEERLYATFGTPGGNASYAAPTYTWTASSNNLMTVFEFSNGELKNYTTLKFTISNLSEGASVRMGYYVGSTFTEIGKGYYSNGTKEVDLTALGVDLSTVTKISFGGRNASGSVDIKAADVILSK